MSLVGKRAEFAAALTTVDGCKGYTKQPSAPRQGDAWPVWGGQTVEEDNIQFTNTWSVFVFLPQNQGADDEWIDSHIEALWDAVQPVAHVTGFSPAEFSDGQRVLLISTRSE